MTRNSIAIVSAATLLAAAGAVSAQVTQDLGGGWSVTIFNPEAVSVTSQGVFGNQLILTKVATVFGTTDEGIPTPIVLQFSQNLPSAQTVPQIGIAFENITNLSGTAWTSYQQILALSSRVSFNQAASAAFSTLPFTNTTYNAATGATQVTYDGGVVPNGSTWNGGGGNPIVIDIALAQTPTVFTLKEVPLPTPGAAAVATLGGLLVARRRRP